MAYGYRSNSFVGSETSLSQCGHDPWGTSDCGSHETLAIACNMQTYDDATHGKKALAPW